MNAKDDASRAYRQRIMKIEVTFPNVTTDGTDPIVNAFARLGSTNTSHGQQFNLAKPGAIDDLCEWLNDSAHGAHAGFINEVRARREVALETVGDLSKIVSTS